MNTAIALNPPPVPAYDLIERLRSGETVSGEQILTALGSDIANGYRVGRGSIVNLVRDNPDMSRSERQQLCELLRQGIAASKAKRPSLALSYDAALRSCLELR